MDTKEIMIDGKVQNVQLFESLIEYVEDTVIENSPYRSDSEEPYLIRMFDLRKIFNDQMFTRILFFEDYNIDGKQYIRVNWGEEEISMIPDDDFRKCYAVYQKVGRDTVDLGCNLYLPKIQKLFVSRKEAKEAAEAVF